LDAVLADIARRGADVTVNLGDILSGPLWPRETAERLMALQLPTIRGNHERQLLACDAADCAARHAAGEVLGSDAYAAACVTPAQRDWLAALPNTLRLTDDVLLCHGTPTSDHHYLLETVDASAPDGCRAATPDELRVRLAGVQASLILCGHTHLQRIYCAGEQGSTADASMLVVNAGSVGVQAFDDDWHGFHKIQNRSAHARYALCERTRAGWQVALHAVAYDWASAVAQARANGHDDYARWLTGFA
ncbi:MAG: metallophosphoesterase, partial [Betaproteobacteria bacterium]|nr:metallophosphoesterase [Betaproteobacteria bacterium]